MVQTRYHGQLLNKSTHVHWSHRAAVENPRVSRRGQRSPSAALRPEGPLSPAGSLLPAGAQICAAVLPAAHTPCTWESRALLLCSLFVFCKQSIPCVPQRVYEQVIQIWGLEHANLLLFGLQQLSGRYRLKGLQELIPRYPGVSDRAPRAVAAQV